MVGNYSAVFLCWFAVLPVALLAVLTSMAYRHGYGLHVMVLGLSLFHEVILVGFPNFYDLATHFSLENEMAVDVALPLLAKVMLGESVYLLAFSVPIFWSIRKRRIPARLAPSAVRANHTFMIMLMVLGLVLYGVQFLTTPVVDYESYKHFAEAKVHENIGEMIYAWIKGAFAFPCLFAAGLIVSDKRSDGIFRWASFGIIALLLMYGLATGYRGRITWVASLLLVGALINRNRMVLLYGVVLLAVTGAFAQFMGGEWRSISINDLAGQSQWSAMNRALQEAKSGNALQGEKPDFLRMVAKRAQGPRNSAVLYMLYEEGRGGGTGPILSSFATVIPRVFWPDKGIGGSSDDTPYGAAIFLVRFVGYDAPLFNMGPVLASGHAYWEGGWIWVVAGGLCAGMFWALLLRFAYRLPVLLGRIICLSYAASLLIDGLFTIFNPIYTFVLATINVVSFVYLSYLCIQFFHRIRPAAIREPQTAEPGKTQRGLGWASSKG